MSDVVMSRPTTHVLPLGLAGTMTANGSCLQWSAMVIAGSLFTPLRQVF